MAYSVEGNNVIIHGTPFGDVEVQAFITSSTTGTHMTRAGFNLDDPSIFQNPQVIVKWSNGVITTVTWVGMSVPPVQKHRVEFKTFTSSSGKYKVKAKFLELKDGKVSLETESGRTLSVDISRLRRADQAWIRKEVKRDRTE